MRQAVRRHSPAIATAVVPCKRTAPLRAAHPCRSGIYFPAMTDQVVKMLGLALVVIFGRWAELHAGKVALPRAEA